ncbi:MAG: 5,10-methylenetetrahydromethanopterin reductase [Halobacteriales archaeon]
MAEVELVAEHPVPELVELAVEAERRGFEAVWVTDHFNNRNPWVVLSAMATATDRVELGPGVTNPYYAHPAWTASAVMSLDELSDGRARLGIGAGDPSTLATLGIERESPLYDVLDAVELTRGLSSGERTTVEGLLDDAGLNYGPREVPVYVGAQGPNMLRMANDRSDGVLINASHPRDFEWSFDQLDEKKTEMLAYTSFSVDGDRERARDAARQPVAFVAAGSPPPVLDRHDLDHEVAESIASHIEKGEFRDAFDAVTDGMIDAFSVAGTPDDCRERAREILDTGVDTLVVGSPIGPEPKTALSLAASVVDEVEGN